jgi:hypothetical protein
MTIMPTPIARAATLAVLALLISPVRMAAQDPPGGTAAVAREVAAALKEYHRIFSGKRADEMAKRAYAAPLMSLGRGSYTVWTTPQDVEKWAGGFVANLQTQGWDRSEMPSPSICVLTPTSAIASGEFVRYRSDGSVLSRHGSAYVFSKGPEGWRVVAMLSHDPKKPLRCDS